MNARITQDTIILFIYNELDELTKLEVQKELNSNEALRAYYEEQLKVIQYLDNNSYEPHETSVNIVLEESLSSNLETI